ncbi:MAG: Co2+/Mg2+ efflux protein ApaG [Gammaproteobacteria bacterium]|nr:Co2+/Mg2+ efflux protein ApaG [Gammaproteobacteria bacterium]
MKDDNEYRIDVTAQSQFVRHQSEPEENRYVFAYTVIIKNTGSAPAQLKSRHWIITDAQGQVQEVRGDGVIGEQPRLEPGESFRYTSAAMLETPVGTMHGSYQMVADDGTKFDAPIAPFSLAIPNMVH